MLEYESKIWLTEEEYKDFLSFFSTGKRTVHTNFYYDTDQLELNQKGITYRIRKRKNQYIATIKKHRMGDRTCSEEISRAVADELDCSLFGDPTVELKGSLTTERYELRMDEDLQFVLDRNIYLGHTDYEIEIEYPQDKKDYGMLFAQHVACYLASVFSEIPVEQYLKRIGIGKSKSERFFERYSKLIIQ